jgi:hypothetical protein
MPADQLENRCVTQDLKVIASKISDRFGAFSPSNLVNYGKTVIVKPGATTVAGRPIRGVEVMEALDGEYSVQPLAVTYGGTPSIPSGEDADAFERAMNMELDAAEADTDSSEASSDDSFGIWDPFSPDEPMMMSSRDRRLRHRYSRISSRFGRFAMFALSSRSLRHREAAGRVFGRIKRLWERMMRRGVPVVGLMSPASIRARVYALSKGVSSAPVPAPFQQSSSVSFPLRAPMVVQSPGMPLPMAFDQAALERSVGVNASSQLLAQTFGGVPRVSADARAETVGYLFSGMEHDYYGLVSTPFQIVLADEDEAVLSEDEDVAAAEGELGLSAPPEVEAPRPQVRSDLPDDDADLEAAEERDIPDDISPGGGSSGGSVDLPDDDSDIEDMDVDDQGLAMSDEDLEDDADLLDDDDDMMEGEGSFAKADRTGLSLYKWVKNHRAFNDAIKSGRLEVAKKEWAQLKSMFDSLSEDQKKKLRSPKSNFVTLDAISHAAGKVNLALTMQATGLTSEQICGTTKKTKKKGYGFDGLPDDDSDIDFALGSDDDLLDEDFGDDDLPDDDEDLMVEEDEAPPSRSAGPSATPAQKASAKPKPKDDVAKAVDAAVDAASDAASLVSTVKTMSTPEAVAASPEHAKRLARARAKTNAFLSKLQSDAASAEARGDRTAVDALKAQILSLHSRLTALNEAIQGASMSGSINYGALIPASGSDADKIVVIAIRKTPAKVSVEQAEIVKYAGSRGVRSDGHLADVFGSDLVSARQIYFSGPLVASQTGSMSAERAMEVFGGYLWGVDEEAKRMAAFGAADESILSRYNKAMDRFNEAKSSDNQDLAAKMLGRMRVMFSSMSSDLKSMAVDPSGLQVPGIEISKMTSPEASAAFANVEKMT